MQSETVRSGLALAEHEQDEMMDSDPCAECHRLFTKGEWGRRHGDGVKELHDHCCHGCDNEPDACESWPGEESE